MSILIKGMEMPTEGTVIVIYKLNGKFYASVHGTELCPLIEVPTLHGDLIDRKALLEGEGRYLISLCKEGIDVEEILRAKTVIPADKDGET